jgi:glycosyltransferase involved in cell wall biosynthesis
MNKLKLSVIIPTYNRYAFLKKCLQSICNQTFSSEGYEIIVIDDGSTDDTESISKKFKNNKINFHFHRQENAGPAAARNLGVALSSGDILVFIDDDCVAPADFLRNIDYCFENYSEADVCVGKIIPVFDNIFLRQTTKYLEKKYRKESNTIVSQATPKTELRTDCSAVKKECFVSVGGFDTKFKLPSGEDVDLGFKLLERGFKILFTSKVVIYHHQRSDFFKTVKRYFIFGMTDTVNFKKYFVNKIIFSGVFNKYLQFNVPKTCFYFHVNMLKIILFILLISSFNKALSLFFIALILFYNYIKVKHSGGNFMQSLAYLCNCLFTEVIFLISHVIGSIKNRVFYL